jgi:DNA-binding MarR family transcriptional regulator
MHAACEAVVAELPAFIGAQRELFDAPRTLTTLVTLGAVEQQGVLRASELAEAVGLDPSTVTRQVAHLRAEGWLDAQPDPDDRRAQQLCVTAAGREQLALLRQQLADRLERRMSGWSEAELTALAQALQRYSRTVAARRPATSSGRPGSGSPSGHPRAHPEDHPDAHVPTHHRVTVQTPVPTPVRGES